MSFQVSAVPTSLKRVKQETNRPSANFHPTIWGDFFLHYASESMENDNNAKVLELKEEIKRMLMADPNKPAQKLDLVDAIQRLGVSYHFEAEIDEILEQVYEAHQHESDLRNEPADDLYSISLQFRLLRQHGYRISCDVFNKFKDSKGNFKTSLGKDIEGILSLYEATHLRVHGEDILDEAFAFTTCQLESMATQLSPSLAEQVRHALIQPIQKNIPRLEARYYMSIYEQDSVHNKALLTFAKLDFNMLQKLHKKELSGLTRWWKGLDIPNKLPFARDRVVELYFNWVYAVYFEPKYSYARKILAKLLCLCTILDDIYDAHGSFEELEPFTTAIERWDCRAAYQLPEYMKHVYEVILDVYNEIEIEMALQGKLYRFHYAKEAFKELLRHYFIEARWYNQQYVPLTLEEHLSVSLISCGYKAISITSFVGMGDTVTKAAFEWAFGNPKIIKAASTVSRLTDDIADREEDKKRGHVASTVDCFMNQYSASEEEAIQVLRQRITNAWKDINEDFLRPTAVPMPLLERVLNLARTMDVLYKEKDCYTNPHLMKDFVISTLRDPVPI